MDTEQRLDPRRRELHPERIEIGGEILIRNDVQARQLGCSERSIDRGDERGAPFIFIAGIKYRPERRYVKKRKSTKSTGHAKKVCERAAPAAAIEWEKLFSERLYRAAGF